MRSPKAFITLLLLLMMAIPKLYGMPAKRNHQSQFSDYISRTGSRSGLGLIDPSRLTLSHNVQMGFSSFRGGSMMSSLYATTANYRVSDPVSLGFTFGMLGAKFNGPGYPNTYRDLIGGASLDYRPNNDWHFRFEISRGPGYYGLGYNDHYDPFSSTSRFRSLLSDE